MKKIYLLGLLALGVSVQAQTNRNVKPAASDATATEMKTHDQVPASPVRVNPNPTMYPATYFGKNARVRRIGITQNDQQTNGSIYRHLYVFPDGKMSATWTTSTDGAPYQQRGSGYNHNNGTGWGPVATLRIENERAGFPNFTYNDITGEEIITSHRVIATQQPNAGAAGGIFINRKELTGSTWTTTYNLDTIISYPGVLWARSAVQGDLLHVIASFTDSSQAQPTRVIINGVRSPQVYSRYRFSNNTWEVKNAFLPEYDSTRQYAGGGDNYAIDVNGSHVAILIGGLTDDLSLWKSADSGLTWTKTIVDSFPVPAYAYNVTVDTSFSNDGCVSVLLDNNGNAHCFWGLARVLDDDAGDGQITFFPGQQNLMYWNETWPYDSVISIATALDEDNSGEFRLGGSWSNQAARYGNHSVVSMPSVGITADGHIYVLYSSLTDNDISGEGRNFRDVYITRSLDNGTTWARPVNLTNWLGFNVEQVFGSMARLVNDKIYFTFMQKSSIGRYDADNNPGAVGPYDIFFMEVDTAGLFTETLVGLAAQNEQFTIGQNYPNPFRSTTSVDLMLKSASDVSVTVVDIVGRVVYTSNEKLESGKHTLDIQLGNVPSGVYFYTIEANGVRETRKMIVE